MNCKIGLSLLSASLATSSLMGQIEITENFVITGFVDMSVSWYDDGVNDEVTAGLDQVELDFIYTFQNITAQADIDYQDDGDDGDPDSVELEQAFVTYDFGTGFSITAGKYLSYLGFETAEPTGLYQYSYAYDVGGYIPGYHNGVKLNYSTDLFSVGVSIVDDIAVGPVTKRFASDDFGFEVFASVTPAEGLTIFAGYARDEDEDMSGETFDIINLWASYEIGSTTIAAEFNTFDYYGTDGISGLVMVNFGLTEKLGLTLRASMEDWDDTPFGTLDNMKYSISPGYAITENLFVLAEFSLTDWDQPGADSAKLFAVEALFTF